ncbi:RidA family protein [Chitinophaga rhizosphaerae]|uniref:RidA family protein n=1 Tax=Chitinophaga rhizosphaerae TaxID=1864947 RepID=UPI00196A9A9B|nr:RidA family protein [Chitinophaga rhizosphaerae]
MRTAKAKRIIKRVIFIISILITMTTQAQQHKNPPALFDPAPYGFSHMATVPAGYRFIFIAGQGGEEDTTGRLSPDFRRQVAFSLKNIRAALAADSLGMDDVVKVTTLVVDHSQEKLAIIVEEFHKIWPKKNFPVNTLIPVPKLAIDGMLVEIDAMAVRKPGP